MQNLQYLPRSLEAREVLFEDRTRAHADHVGHGLDRMTTAAVGILKAVNCGEKPKYNRITKVGATSVPYFFSRLHESWENRNKILTTSL